MTIEPIAEIFGNGDIDPIPLGIRVGNLVHAARLTGVSLDTGALGDGVEAQLELLFTAIRHVVETSGGTTDNVAQVSFFLKRFDDRALINPPWTAMFPNDLDRPTYKFMAAQLPDDCLVKAEMWAVLAARRQVINTPPVAHTNPIPMGVKIGGYVFSSRILPFEPATNAPGDGLERQAAARFSEPAVVPRRSRDQPRESRSGQDLRVRSSTHPDHPEALGHLLSRPSAETCGTHCPLSADSRGDGVHRSHRA